jgi:EamA domain-containing membrane protein RarD
VIKVYIIAFLAAITITSYFLLRKRSGQNLIPAYLLSITTKILLSCVFVIFFILSDKEGANSNIALFLVGYVIFTAVEVTFLLLKKKA